MSLGLKEVLSIDTDFVSKKDKKPEGNDKPDKPFSEMNDSEIEIAAKALLREELQKTPSLGVTEVEDLSKEAQTIFSDIVAWMLERKMRDHEGAIATDNENAEWRESLAELTASVVSTARSFEPFFQNKEHRTEYRKRFLNEKISLLECYEDIVLAPLKGAIQKRDIDKKEVEKLENDISENNQKFETKTLELDLWNRFKKDFIEEFEEFIEAKVVVSPSSFFKKSQDFINAKGEKLKIEFDNLKTKCDILTNYKVLEDQFKKVTNSPKEYKETFNSWKSNLGSIEDDKSTDIDEKIGILSDTCTLKDRLDRWNEFGKDFIQKFKEAKAENESRLSLFSSGNQGFIENEGKTLKNKFGATSDLGSNFVSKENIWTYELKQDVTEYRRYTLWQISEEGKQGSNDSINNNAREMIDEFEKIFNDEKKKLFENEESLTDAKIAELKRDIDDQVSAKIKLYTTISNIIAKKIDEQLVGEEINSFKKHIEDLKKQSEEDNKVLVELEKELKLDQDNITSIEAIIETNPAGTPWKEERLPKNSGSNTIYKIEYVLGGGEPPIVIEEFSYPIQKSVRSKNSAVAKRLILLLLVQKPVEDDKVLEARKDVEKAKKELEEAKNESNVQPGQQPSEISKKTEALKEVEENLDEAKVAAKENENKLYKNAPIGVEVVKQVAFLGKTITRVIKTSQTSSNGRKKRAFDRAADCYGAIPVVLGATLASLEAGFAFNKDKEREAI